MAATSALRACAHLRAPPSTKTPCAHTRAPFYDCARVSGAGGMLAQMGGPQSARAPAPGFGFDLMEVKVLISGLAGVVAIDAAIKKPTRSKTKSPADSVKRPL